MNTKNENKDIIIYQDKDGQARVSVKVKDETLWLTQKAMADLFGVDRSVITKHLKNIFESEELKENSVCAKFAHTAEDGKTYNTNFYNLDAIIAVGYRVNSKQATRFRIWATQVLKEYMIKGFALDDDRLKGTAGGNYWKELLDRIRDIRSSEKVLYRQVLDLYATSVDYDAHSPESIQFFKIVQNKLHYAVNNQTASEIIYNRANAEKEFMGLTSFKGEIPIKSDISIAKNYLNEDELFRLNRLVSAFFDLAELRAQEHKKMYMKDWILELDKFTKMYGKGTLKGAGTVSHKQAIQKAEKEYNTYQVKTLSPVEKAYIKIITELQKTAEKKYKKERKR